MRRSPRVEAYIAAAKDICDMAGVRAAPERRRRPLASRGRGRADLTGIFDLIGRTTARTFGEDAPELVCEPGRGLCGDAFADHPGEGGARRRRHLPE